MEAIHEGDEDARSIASSRQVPAAPTDEIIGSAIDRVLVGGEKA
jgi:hypothetical protein